MREEMQMKWKTDFPVGCVIMASGQGKRFGGNKLMSDFGAEPLIAGALRATEGCFAQRLVVTRHKDVADYCTKKGVSVLLHELPMRSDTVRLGIAAMEEMAGCLFCPGDQPLLSRESVGNLVRCARKEPEFIWRTVWKDQPGAPVLFPRWTFSELRSLPAGAGGSYLMKKYPQRVRYLPVSAEYELWDVDTAEDLNRLLKCIKKDCKGIPLP